MALVNRTRGEVALEIDGIPRTLCVTLGALAEMEAAFDVGSLSELGERLAALTPSDLITLIAALLQGASMTAAEIAAARIDAKDAALAVAQAFRLAFDDGA